MVRSVTDRYGETDWPEHVSTQWHTPSGHWEPQAEEKDMLVFRANIGLEDMRIDNIEQLCQYIQEKFDYHNLTLKIWFEDGHTHIEFVKTKDYVLKIFALKVSSQLANILGFGKEEHRVMSMRFDKQTRFQADYAPSMSLLFPTNFIVLCDIVNESVFGDKSIRILRLLSASFNAEREMVSFSFDQDEPIDLYVKEFSTIRIQILDATGNLLKTSGAYPTRCQLLFAQKPFMLL